MLLVIPIVIAVVAVVVVVVGWLVGWLAYHKKSHEYLLTFLDGKRDWGKFVLIFFCCEGSDAAVFFFYRLSKRIELSSF